MRNQLFVSYRRVANDSSDKWVDVFCEALRKNLREMVGNEVALWRDSEELQPGMPWRPQLQLAIDEATIFLAVVSRSYFAEDECRRELDWFLRRIKQDPKVPRLIMPVFKQPPSPQKPPPPDVGILQRHEFFVPEPGQAGRWREFSPSEAEFWNSLARLAQDITLALEGMDGSTQQAKVYLARVCPELESQREAVRADLRQHGFEVVPQNEYFWNANDIDAQISADLEGAVLCVHMVSGAESADPDGVEHSQRQLLAAHNAMKARGGVAPLVWIQGAAKPHASAADLIRVITEELADDGVEVLRGSIETLKEQVYDKIKAAQPADAAALDGEVTVIVEEGDLLALGALTGLLADELEVDTSIIKLRGAVPDDPARMAKALADNPRCIIFWRAQPLDWLKDVLRRPELVKHLSRDRLCVCTGGEPSDEKSIYRSPKATVVDTHTGTAAAALRVFLAHNAGS